MKRKMLLQVTIASILSVAAAIVFTSGCAAPQEGPTPAPAKAEPITWEMASNQSSDIWLVKDCLTPFIEAVERETNGQLKMVHYPSGALGYKAVDHLDVISEGLAPMADISGGFSAGELPVLDLGDVIGVIPSDEAIRFNLWDELYSDYRDILLDRFGVYTLAIFQVHPQRLGSTEPIKSLADFKGLKVRVSGAAQTNFSTALGASPVTIPFVDLYMSMQRGVIDAYVTSDAGIMAIKGYEVSDYLGPSFGGSFLFICVNKEAMDSLSSDVQDVVWDLARNQLQPSYKRAYHKAAAESLEFIVGQGMELVPFPEEDLAKMFQLNQSNVDDWVAQLDAQSKAIYDEVVWLLTYWGYR